MAYLDAVLERGLAIDVVAPYFHFVVNVDMDFFEARLQAAGVSQALGAADEGALRRDARRTAHEDPHDDLADHDARSRCSSR